MPEISWISPPKFDKQVLNQLQQLINEYENKHKTKVPPLNERATGQALIEPLLEILGWNPRNIDEVYPEYYVTGSGRVDYVLQINSMPVVYAEIKSISENLDGNRGGKTYEDQSMDYAWKKKATWAVLTNFKELRLYNAKERILVFRISYQEYITKFEATLRYLVRDAVQKGDIGQLYAVKTGKEIEDGFLNDLQKWRLDLANNIHLNNSLKIEEISFQTQKILNRLILIRIAEDRGSLPRGQLQNEYANWKNSTRSKRKKFFNELEELFMDFEFDFNTELFKKDLCDELIIENSAFDELVRGLYEYDFSTMTGDILGSTYELYLGYALEPTNTKYLHSENIPKEVSLGLVLKKECRQRKGIFYTRPPVVDFIVSNTVAYEVAKRNTEELKKLCILDASGGSGSFLIKAMTVIRNRLVLESLKSKKTMFHKNPFQSELASLAIDDIPKLVLKNNIYLVDLDPESVEIAKLNLWAQSLHPKFGDEKVLLNLEHTFKCGNTLVPDAGDFADLSPDLVKTEIRPFDWEAEFPEIFPKESERGFDIVIGNPPYYSVHFIDERMKTFLQTHYADIHTGQNDIHYYFYKKGIDLLREGGLLGFITSKYFIKADDSSRIRAWILDNCKIRTIVDFGNIDMFGGIGTRTAVLILEKCSGTEKAQERASNVIHVSKVKCRRWLGTKRELVSTIEKYLERSTTNEDTNIETFTLKQADLSSEPWELISEEEKAVKTKIEAISVPLDLLCHCCKGMDTGLNDIEREKVKMGVFHLTRQEAEKLQIEPRILRKIVKNSEISKYSIDFNNLFLVYATDDTDITLYPKAYAHLERFKPELSQRYGFHNGHRRWYAISSPRHKELIDNCKEKLICPYIAPENTFAYDNCSEEQRYYGMTDTTTVVPREGIKTSLKYILAVLNSSLENFYYKTFSKDKDYRYEYFAKSIKKMRIPDEDRLDEPKKLAMRELVGLSSERINLGSQQNSQRKAFSEALRNNAIEEKCDFEDYLKDSVAYSFQKTILLETDLKIESCEIELVQEGNSITVNAYFDGKWHSILKMDFSEPAIRDFFYFGIDRFIRSEELSVSWRKGKIISDVVFGLKLPRIKDNHAINARFIISLIAEIAGKASSTNIGEITQRMRTIDKQIDKKTYFIFDINEKEQKIVEEAIDLGTPYLRY